MTSVGDSMLNQAGGLDNTSNVASSAAMATWAALGNTMISKTGRIKTNRKTHLLYTVMMWYMQQKQCHWI